MDTPIVLIIFNRPAYTKKVFDEIAIAKPKKLFIIADGLRNEEDRELVEKAREITEKVSWECDVTRLYGEKNLGSRDRIVSGLNEVFKEVDRAIILEDDCLPDQSFFPFCESMLSNYDKEESVMMITGSNPTSEYVISTSYTFSKFFSIWGWATWRRAWNLYDGKMEDWPLRRKDGWLDDIFKHKGVKYHLKDLFDQCYEKNLNSWATRWFYTCLVHNGLCVTPATNLISNIGVDGVHSSPGINNNVPLQPLDVTNMIHPGSVKWDMGLDNAFFDRSFPSNILPNPRTVILKILVFGKKIVRNLGLIKK